MEPMTCGTAIVRSLIHHGVEVIFGVPGAHIYHLYDALYAHQDRLRHVVTRHEQAAAYMAYGYAKSTGKVGAYACVPGPGVLNTGAALCTAYGANAPVLCITGEIPSAMIGRGRGILHELPDQLATLRLLTKWAGKIDHPTEVPHVMAEAFRQMRSGRMRPVAVQAPWDVLALKATVNPDLDYAPVAAPIADSDAIASAVKLIRAARSPMIMVGGGALHAREEVLELATLLQAPVTAHRSGRGIAPEDGPYGMSCAAAYKLWDRTDLLIGVGSRLELQYLRWQRIPNGLKVVRLDIDPTELVRLKPDVGILCDAKAGLRELLDAMTRTLDKRPSRLEEFAAIKARTRQEIQKIQPQMSYLNVIREVLPRDGFFVEEISQVGLASRFGLPIYEPRTFVTCGYQDNLGFGFPTALGVKVAHPDKPVVSVTGDGGFMFAVQELATAVRHGIRLATVVFNNQAYGNVLRDQKEKFAGRVCGAELTNPDFVKLAESFGAAAYRASTPESFRRALEAALAADVPAVIEVPCERGSEASPWEFLMPGTY